ncbi:EthD family reductase [Saccharomonospora azurea]|uniref:EthD family reductase n=1 Tax=Saccharomonospora azurea TaxID=40988 RepID=UPI003325AC60
MVKFVAVVRRKEGLDFAEFRRLWCEEHPDLVLRMPGVRRYEQNLAYRGESRDWPMDGIAEVWFDDHTAMKRAFASPEGTAATAHQDLFAGEVRWFVAEERTWDGGEGA